MANNIVTALFGELRYCTTVAKWQYDYGQILKIEGVDLPAAYEVHFSNDLYGESTTQIGDENGVTIPDTYFTTGQMIYAWIYLHTENDGETVYVVRIPVRKRASIEDYNPTDEQQDAITQAIAALNRAVVKTGEDSLKSEGYAVGTQDGVEVEPGSPYYEYNSKYFADEAADSAQDAYESETNAATSERNAAASEENVARSEQNAGLSAEAAAQSADDAYRDANRAEQAAKTAGFMEVMINGSGHLIYMRTSQVDADFSLDSVGHLILESVV